MNLSVMTAQEIEQRLRSFCYRDFIQRVETPTVMGLVAVLAQLQLKGSEFSEKHFHQRTGGSGRPKEVVSETFFNAFVCQ